MKRKEITILLFICLFFITGFVRAEEVVAWTFQTGKAIYTNPVYDDGIVYFGSLDSVFYAVNTNTGEEAWHFQTGHPIHSTAAVFENGICFESGNEFFILGFQGQLLYRIPLFTDTLTDQIDTWDLVHSSPNIVEDIAYIGTEQGWVYGINVQTGEEVFKVQTSNHGLIRVMPVVDQGRLYTGDWEGVLTCFDLASGNVLWEYDTKTDATFSWTNAIQTPLLVQDGVLYFAGRSCRAYALDAVTGQKLWMYNQGSVWVVGGTVISEGIVYFGCSNQSLLYALDIQTGESRWNAKIDFRMWNSPLISGDYLIFGSRSLYIMDKNTGDVVNRMFFNSDSVHQEPVHIYYWAADYYGGADMIANFHSSAIEADGKIMIGCDDGKLYAFNRDALINMPKAETTVNLQKTDLGDLCNDSTYVVAVELVNTGTKTDSVFVSSSASSSLKKAIKFEPDTLEVPAGGKEVVFLTISAEALKTKSYTLNFAVDSKYNVNTTHITRSLRFNVVEATGVEKRGELNPSQFNLEPNVPNPFNPCTKIEYSLSAASDVLLTVFDSRGRKVTTLVQAHQTAGNYHAIFDGRDLGSGIYVCMLRAGNQCFSQKMMLMK